MFTSDENKLRTLIIAILTASMAIIFAFHLLILKNNIEDESEQLLYQVGKTYESTMKSEFARFSSLSDLLARTIAKNNNNSSFNKEIRNIFRDLIYRNARLQSIELIMNSSEIRKDSLRLNINLGDSLVGKSVRIVKSRSGIIENTEIRELSDLSTKISIEKAILVDETKILEPEIVQIDGQPTTIVPILSTIYEGKKFLGYIILSVSVSWMSNNEIDKPEIIQFTEIFVGSPDGKVIELNRNKELMAEPIDKVCITCKDLTGNKGQGYNTNIQSNYLSLCIPWQPFQDAEYWNICLRAPLNKISAALNYNTFYSWLLFILLLITAILLMFFALNRYVKIWDKIIDLIQNILKGDLTNLRDESLDEGKSKSNLIRKLLFKLVKSLKELVSLNENAIKGNFEEKNELEFTNQIVYNSTKEVHLHYKSAIEKLDKENSNLKQIKKLTEGLDKVNSVLKIYHTDLQQLSVHIIHTLVDLLEIEMGAVFLMRSDEKGQHLDLIVSYAYSEDRFQKRSFNVGESLVGACAAEKRTIFMKKVPEDYLKIISGLGLASPKSILILPLIFEGEVLGVIELGTLKDFDENRISFAERAAETIANTLSLAEINIKTSELLEKTKQQTLELEERDKKMLEAIDNMKELQIRTAESETGMRAKIDAMNNTLMMVEYTSKGILLDANYKYLNTMNYALEDIKGIDVLELLKEEDKAELIKIINMVKNGNFYEAVMRRHTRHGVEKWLMATYTPVYNDQNTVENILFFAIDITRIRKNEDQLKHKIQELMAQVDDLRAQLKRED